MNYDFLIEKNAILTFFGYESESRLPEILILPKKYIYIKIQNFQDFQIFNCFFLIQKFQVLDFQNIQDFQKAQTLKKFNPFSN